MVELRQWERVGECLTGVVYGHKRFPDGSRIRTSKIKSLKGRWAHTVNGTLYKLGERARSQSPVPHPGEDITVIEDEQHS